MHERVHGRQGVPWKVVGEFHALELVAFSLEAKLKGRGIRSRQKDPDCAGVGSPKAKDSPDEGGVLHIGGSLGAMDWEETGKNKPKKTCLLLTYAGQAVAL